MICINMKEISMQEHGQDSAVYRAVVQYNFVLSINGKPFNSGEWSEKKRTMTTGFSGFTTIVGSIHARELSLFAPNGKCFSNVRPEPTFIFVLTYGSVYWPAPATPPPPH